MSFYHLQIWSELYSNKYASCSRLSPTYMWRGWRVMFGSGCCDSEDYEMCAVAWESGVNGEQQTCWRHFYNMASLPLFIHIYNRHTTCSLTHTRRWTDTNREKGERLTDLLPQFYWWSLSQQANCITNRLIIQREEKRCWERERRRDGRKERDAVGASWR